MADLTLSLFVAGDGPRASTAEAQVRELCERHVGPDYRLEVVDVLASPERAEEASIIATPTLVRSEPPPPIRLVGDLSNFKRAVELLGIA